MNKKMVAVGMTIYTIGFLMTQTKSNATDIEPFYRYELNQTDSARANEARKESTRRIGNDLPRTQQVAPIYGNSPAYIHQDNSGTYLLNSFGQPVGIIGR